MSRARQPAGVLGSAVAHGAAIVGHALHPSAQGVGGVVVQRRPPDRQGRGQVGVGDMLDEGALRLVDDQLIGYRP